MNLSELRHYYHNKVCEEIIRVKDGRKKGSYPNFADGDNKLSIQFAQGVIGRMGCIPSNTNLKEQTVGTRFEQLTREFLQQCFDALRHLRPGKWEYDTGMYISEFWQYEHLAYLAKAFAKDKELRSALGGDYIVKPDIVVGRSPVSDDEINQGTLLINANEPFAVLTPLRAENYKKPRKILHAVISCKWTIRSDRAQNTRTEVLNLIRNRKGRLPHVMAVTAEPLPARIAALALGTGDLDCVYHFALNELTATINEVGSQDSQELLDMMITGRRLRDIIDI